MKYSSLEQLQDAFGPYYAVAADTVGKGITVQRMQRLMEHLGNPERALRVVHVAGTSGKTSTTYFIASLLHASGKNVGYTVSPHVDSITERVQINGAPLDDAVFLQYMDEFLELVADAPETPSWFELIIAFSLWVFAVKERVDYAVLETGMGGLHDATNVCQRADKLCVITDIGLDHQKFLGDTVLRIAAQKAGIIHPGNVVIMYDQTDDSMQAVRFKVSQTEDAELYVQQQSTLQKVIGQSFPADMPSYQQRNWLLAYAAARLIQNRDGLPNFASAQLEQTMQLHVPGRMDVTSQYGTTIIMDGAHNEPKMRAFVDSFRALYGDRKVPVLLALKQDKDAGNIVPLLSEIASEVITTSFAVAQDWPVLAQDPQDLADTLDRAGMTQTRSIPDPQEAFAALLETGHDIVVVTGSFYLISELRTASGVHP